MTDGAVPRPASPASTRAWCILTLMWIAAVAGASTENWVGRFQVSGTLDGEAKFLPVLEFGVHPDATDGFDNLALGSPVDIDQPAPPPPPDDRPDVYLLNASHPASVQQLQADFRGFPADPNVGMTWTLVVDAGFSLPPDSWELGWDVFELGLFWNTARIINAGLGIDADLRATQALEVPLGQKTLYTITVSSDAVSDPVNPQSSGSVATLTSGNVVQATVPSSVFAGEPLVLVAVATTGDPSLGTLKPTGIDVSLPHLIRDITLLRSTTVVSTFPEPIEVTFLFSQQDLTLENGSVIDPATLFPFVISGSTIEVLPVVARGATFVTFTVGHLSLIGLGVSAANDPPTVRQPIFDQTVSVLPGELRVELAASATDSVFFDDESPVSQLTYTAESDRTDVIAAPTLNGTELVLRPALAAQGTATVTVTATDTGGLSTPLTFDVTVIAPILSSVPDQTMAEETELTVTLVALNEADVTYSAQSSEPEVAVTVVGDELTITPARDFAGSAEITVLAADAAAAARVDTTTFTVTVEGVNDPPTFDAIVEQLTTEDVPLAIPVTNVGPGGGADEATQVVSVAASSSDVFIVPEPTIDGSGPTRTLRVVPAEHQSGIVVITVTAADDGGSTGAGGGTLTREFRVVIEAANDAPVFDPVGDVTMRKNTVLELPVTGVGPGGGADELGQRVLLEALTSAPAILPAPVITGDGPNRLMTLSPAPDAGGRVEVTLVATDDGPPGGVNVTTFAQIFSVVVGGDNTLPTVTHSGGPFVVAPGEPLSIPLAVIDPDPDSAVAGITVVSGPSNGAATTSIAPPLVTYTSTAAFTGVDAFSVTVTDDLGGISNPLLIQVTVTDGNLPPVAGPVAPVTLARGASAEITLTGADADKGDTLTFAVETPPEHGSVSIVGATAAYTPDDGYVGADLFTFTVSDGKATSLPSPVRITIGNASPVVKAGSVATNEDTEVAFTIDASDPDGDEITLSLTDKPRHGSLRLNGLAVLYRPDADYSGDDSFAVVASDGETTSQPATFTITVIEVDDAPTLNPSRSLANLRVTEGDDPRTIDVDSPSPLFVDPDSAVALTAQSSDPDIVTATIDGSKLSLEFVGHGVAVISVSAADADDVATMIVEVQEGAALNDPPVVELARPVVGPAGQETTFTPVVTDPDGDALTFELVSVEAASGSGAEPTVTVDAATGETSFIVEEIEGGFAQFRVELQVTDGVNDAVDIATIVTVTPANNVPTIDAASTVEAAVGELLTVDVVVTDADIDDDITLRAVLRTRLDSVVVDATASALRSFNVADVAVDAEARSKTLTLAPGARLGGKLIEIQWFADDGTTSATATTEISVGDDVNRPPAIEPVEDLVAYEGDSIRVPISVSDPEGGAVTISVSGLSGGATFESLTSSVVWIDIGYDKAGAYRFSVTAEDDRGLTVTESVRVEVVDVNRPPVLEFAPLATGAAALRLRDGGTLPETLTLTRGQPAAFRLGVTDPDGDALRLEARGLPIWSRVTRDDSPLAPRLTVVFDPQRDAADLSFVVVGTDAGGQRDSAAINIALQGVANVAPAVEAPGSVTVIEGELAAFTVSASDGDGDALSYALDPLPNGATFDDARFEWITSSGDSRDDAYAFTVTVDDGHGGVSRTTALVTVLPAMNRPPTLAKAPNIVLTAGEEAGGNLRAGAVDIDGDPVTVTLDTTFPPDQMTFDDATGELALSPSVESDGAYRATVTAADGRGGEATRSFLITVLPEAFDAEGDPEILEAFVSPSIGTAADTYEFVTIFRNPAGDGPAVANLFVTHADGSEREVALTADRDADLRQGASYGATLTLPTGQYTFRVVASFGLTLLERGGDGPTVTDAPVSISALTPTGASEDIAVGFEIGNPTPGETVSLTVDYRRDGDADWAPAAVSGAVEGLANGAHEFIWMSGLDAPQASGNLYQLRAAVGDRGERVSSAFPVINAPPPAPTLDPIAPSASLSLVVTGRSEAPGASVTLYVDGRALATAKSDADGAFRFLTGDLEEGVHDLWATVALLGRTSAPSAVVVAAVDTGGPVVEILSPQRGSFINTLDALISFRVDFGVSGGEPGDVTVNLNGRPVEVSFDPVADVFSARKRVFDERAHLITVRARKRNGLAATVAWTFIASLAADDELPPNGTSFRPVGATRETRPEIRLTVGDAAAGVDPESVVLLLDGAELATEYLPVDDLGGTVVARPPAPLTDGDHTVSATFADLAGNEAAVEWTFIVATEVPDAPVIDTSDLLTREQPVTVSGSAAPLVKVIVTDGGSVLATTKADVTGAWTADVSFEEDGAHAVVAQALDPLGSLSDASNAATITLDRKAPSLRVVAPTPGSATGSLRPTISGEVTDDVSGVAPGSVTLTVNGETVPVEYDADQGGFSYTPTADLADAEEALLTLSAGDVAGNVALLSGGFTTDVRLADVTPPVILSPRVNGVAMSPGVDTQVGVTSLDFEFRVTDDLSGIARVYVSYDGESVEPDIEDDRASFSVPDAAEGPHAIVLGAEDGAGNQGDPVVLGVLVRTQLAPPVLHIPAATNAADFTVTGSGVPPGVTATVFVNGLPVSTSVQGDRLTGGPARLIEGANIVTATITDKAGNTATSENQPVLLDVTPPLAAFVFPTPDATVDAGSSTLRVQISDAVGVDAESVVLTLDDAVVNGEFLDDATVEYAADEPFGVGRHFAVVTVRDVAGNEARRGLSFAVDGSAPEVRGIVPADGEITPALSPLVAATIVDDDVDLNTLDVLFGPEDGALRSVVNDADFAFDFNLGQFAFVPALDNLTSYRVVVRVSDRVGNPTELSWTFHVDTDAEDVGEPAITILFPAPGQTIGDTGLDILTFSVADSGGVDSVAIFINDPRGDTPLSLGRLVDEGIAEFNRATGLVRIHGRRLFAPYQGKPGGANFDPLELNALERGLAFAMDPLELNALERSLGGGGGASFDPLELNALERNLSADTGGGGEIAALERSLTTSPGLLGVGTNTMGVQALDLSGNVSFASWSFDVSLDPPAAPIFTTRAELTNSRSSAVTGYVPGLVGSGALPIALSLRVNGVASGFVEVHTEDGEFAFTSVPLNVGENSLTATAQDAAGNLSDRSEAQTLFVDIEPPSVRLNPIPSSSALLEVTVGGSVTDNLSGELAELSLVVNGVEAALALEQGAFAGSAALDRARNTVFVRAVDAAGNVTATDEATVSRDVDAPVSAPATLAIVPSENTRGVKLRWDADPGARSYKVYRSTRPFTVADGLTPIASSVAGADYTDASAPEGETFYYAVASVDDAGNSDPAVLSPVRNATLIRERGGAATLADGTRLVLQRRGLFTNILIPGVVEITTPTDLPPLSRSIDGSAREVTVRDPKGVVAETFAQPARLTIPVPLGVVITSESPVAHLLARTVWAALDSTRSAPDRTVSASIPGSAVIRLGETGDVLLEGDVDRNGVVDIVDLVTVGRLFGTSAEPGAAADVNGDGAISIIDLVTVASQFGARIAQAAPSRVPAGDPVVRVALEAKASESGATEVTVLGASTEPLAGYSMRLWTATTPRVEPGDALGTASFWMTPLVEPSVPGASTQLAAARLGATVASAGGEPRVLARLFVQGDPASVLRSIRLDAAQFSDGDGRLLPFAPTRAAIPAYRTALHANYPNPFNPETWIPFSLESGSDVRVRIYDERGALVRELDLGDLPAGDYRSRAKAAHWDGRNRLGERVASAVYYYELVAAGRRMMRRMVVLK